MTNSGVNPTRDGNIWDAKLFLRVSMLMNERYTHMR